MYLKINNINLQYFVKKIPNKQKKSKEKGNKPTKNLKKKSPINVRSSMGSYVYFLTIEASNNFVAHPSPSSFSLPSAWIYFYRVSIPVLLGSVDIITWMKDFKFTFTCIISVEWSTIQMNHTIGNLLLP